MKSQRVLTYATVDQLFEPQSLFNDYSDVLHITSTSTLRRGLMTYMAEEERLIKAPILTFAQILNVVGCDISRNNLYDNWPWYSRKTQLKQFTRISQILREINKQNKSESPKIYHAMTKNKDVLLRTLRMLTEAGETAATVKQKLSGVVGYEEKLAITVWEKLEQDVTYQAFTMWKQQIQVNKLGSNNIEMMFTKIFSSLLMSEEERQSANILPKYHVLKEEQLLEVAGTLANAYVNKKKIVLHGFYFITPIQQLIINSLQAAGFEIIQLVNYQSGYQSVFKVIDVYLNKSDNQFEPVTTSIPIINKIAKKFLNVCEGDFQIDVSDMPDKYFEFNYMYQFKHYIQNELNTEKETNEVLISPRAREVRAQVEDISTLKQLTLKDYPIGQFLLDLHSLSKTTFDEESESFKDREELSIDLLMRIFSLGYIHNQGDSTRNLVKDLSKLRERLVGKVSFQQWKKEIECIMEEKQLYEQALTPDGMEVTVNQEPYVYKNRALSYYEVTINNLERILEALKTIEQLYEIIYLSDSNVKVKNYAQRLVAFFNSEIISKIDNEEEIAVAQELLSVFEDMGNSDIETFDRQDLIQGLRFFLSEELENNENSLFGESLIDSKIVSLQDGDILPFLDNQAVHLAFLDNKALPLSQNLVTWPFSGISMDILYEKATKHSDQYIELVQLRKQYDAAITKYLLYLSMSNAASLKFSIVRNLGTEQELKKSFYLDLLELNKASEEAKNNKSVSVIKEFGYDQQEVKFMNRNKTHLLDATQSYCSKRFVLSYMLQTSPSFETNYQHRFLYEKYIAQLNHLVAQNSNHPSIDFSKEDIRNLVSGMFPHWSDTKKQILAEQGEKWKYYTNQDTVDGVTFMDHSQQLYLFGSKPPESNEFANAGFHCKYCPFQDRCRESEFSKDE